MTPRFYDLVVGGVMIAPIVRSLGLAILVMLVLRPLLGRFGFGRWFSNPSLAECGVFVAILALITILT